MSPRRDIRRKKEVEEIGRKEVIKESEIKCEEELEGEDQLLEEDKGLGDGENEDQAEKRLTRGRPGWKGGDTLRIGKGNAGKRSSDTKTDDWGTKGIGSDWPVEEADRPLRTAEVS